MKVLIIDDEAIVRRALSRAFSSKKHEVKQAENALVGEQIWREFLPDAVVVDVLMPEKTGPELIEDLKSFIASYNVKIVLISAFSGDYDVKLAKYKNVDLFIKKPFQNIFELVKKIEGIVK